MGDFAGYAIKQCVYKKIHKAIIAAFIGKLTKMAMGIKQTHVRGSHVSMEFMAKVAARMQLLFISHSGNKKSKYCKTRF